jgi:hypothetical protein
MKFNDKKLNDIVSLTLRYPFLDTCYYNLPDPSVCIDLFVKRLSSDDYKYNDDIANIVINIIKNKKYPIEKLLKCKNEEIIKHVSQIIDKSPETYKDEIFSKACKGLPVTKQIIFSLIGKGNCVTEQSIIEVLTYGTCESIEFILDLGKVQLTKTHFQTLITGQSTVYKNIHKRQVMIENDKVLQLDDRYGLYIKEMVDNYSSEKMMILLDRGLTLDNDDILFSVTHQKELPLIEKFVTLNNDFLLLCRKHNFYPKYKFDCISPDMLNLQNLCLAKNLPGVRAFLKKNKLVPDSICMENASRLKNNEKTIKLLVDAGGVANGKSLLLCAEWLRSEQMTMLLNSFIKNTNDNK